MLARTISYYIFRGGAWIELHSHSITEGSVVPRKGEVMSGFGGNPTDYEVTKVRYEVWRNEVEIELTQLFT